MKLYALIDSRNYAIIGMFGRDDDWVDSDNYEPVSPVYNEQGGRDVTPEDIAYATVEVAGEVYASPDVKAFCEDYEFK